jgi:glycerol-3-phosphate dehydrogenase
MRHPERLTLSFVRSAAERGAIVANYVEVERLLTADGAMLGAAAVDRPTGARFDIRASAVVVAAGPWSAALTGGATGRPVGPAPRQALALNLAIIRPLAKVAVGVRALSDAATDPVIGGHRFLFLAPQEGSTLLGTWYALDRGGDPRTTVEQGVETLLAEFNAACPELGLGGGDVARVYWGRLPLKAGLERGRPDALAERPRVRDHVADGVRHLFSVEGVKYTTARRVAAGVVTRVVRDLGRADPGCRTAVTPLADADPVPAGDPDLATRLRAAVRDEMALTLADVVYRRTGLGEPPGPEWDTVSTAGRIVGDELGWDQARLAREVEQVMQHARELAGAPREVVA